MQKSSGYERELAEAAGALSSGRGVFIVSARGAGRDSFVRALLSRLDDATRSIIWVGEDLDGFDESQAHRLNRAVREHALVPLATLAERRALPAGLADLWKDGFVTRVELGAMSAAALLQFVEDVLGARLSSEAVPSLIPARGGVDIGALNVAIQELLVSGTLAQAEDGLWHLTRPTSWSDGLRRLLVSRPGLGDSEAETLLDVVALVPGLALSTVERIAEQLAYRGDLYRDLEALEDAGAMELLDPLDDPLLRLRDGVAEMLLPKTLGLMRRRRLVGTIVDVLSDVDPARLAPAELVALASHALDLQRSVDPLVLTHAARASLRSPDSQLSLRIAVAAVESGGGFDAELGLAAAEVQLGQTEAARTRLHRIASDAVDDLQRGTALSNLLWLAVDRSEDPNASLDASDGSVLESKLDAPLRADARRGFLLFAMDDIAVGAELIRPALGVLQGEQLGHGHFILAIADMLHGRVADAREHLEAARHMILSSGADIARVENVSGYLAQWEGRITESIESARELQVAAERFGQWEAQSSTMWTLGGLLLTSGRVPEATAQLRGAIDLKARVGHERTVPLVYADLATALAHQGDVDGAFLALEVPLAAATSKLGLAGKANQALGWAHASAGRREQASEAFQRAADSFAGTEYELATLAMLVDAARVGGVALLLPRIDALAERVEGAHFRLMVRNARAIAAVETPSGAHRPELATELEAIAAEAAAIALHMVAAEAFARAAWLHRELGSARGAAAAARKRDEQLAICGIDRLPHLAWLEQSPADRLSERELQIATLAAAGDSNREIAATLVLSVRTIETHLQRVYQKIGIRNRSELPAVLESMSPANTSDVPITR